MRFVVVMFFMISIGGSLFPQPLSGNYTIGGAGANYPTIGAATSALSTSGISGPVVFSIASGVYNESVEIGPVLGTDSTNTIVFESANLDSTSVTVSWPTTTSTANNYALRFNGASFTTFRYMTFERTGAYDYSLVVDIINGSHHITLFHNRITGTTATTAASYKSLVYGANSNSTSNIRVEGNRMENGSFGVWLIGISQLPCCIDKGNFVADNHMINQYQGGIYLQYQGGPQITGNTIEGTSAASGFGIYTFFADNDLRILKNKISIVNGKGIYVHNASITGIPENLIANNFVSIGGTGAAEGILLDNSKSCNIYFNSVHIYNTAQLSTAFKVNGINSGFNWLMNNNLANSGGGYSIYVTASTSQPLSVSDYNNLFVTATFLGFWQAAGSQPNLNAYRIASSLDQNSISTDPLYVSNTDLHATAVIMNNKGSYTISSATPVYDDIDGELRHPFTPDIGADEYSVNDLALLDIDTLFSLCEGQSGELRLTLANNLASLYADTLEIVVKLSGVAHGQVSLPLVIPAFDTVQLTVSGLSTWPVQGNYVMTVYLYDQWDIDRSNDTVIRSINITQPVVVDLGGDKLLCDNQIILLSTSQTFSSYQWHDSSFVSTWKADATTLMPGYNLLWLSAINDRGCSGADTVTINLVPAPVPKISADPSFIGYVAGDTLTMICQKFTTVFSCGSFYSYLWYNGITDSILMFQPYQVTIGQYDVSVTVYDTLGCSNSDTMRIYIDDCQFVEELSDLGNISVYPNPAISGQQVTIISKGISGASQLRIFNIYGEEALNQDVNLEDGVPLKIDTSQLDPGNYFIQCLSVKNSQTIRLIIR